MHNGFDGEFLVTSTHKATRSTKVYPHFDQVIALIRGAFPDLTVVQIGTKTSQCIPGVDCNLVERTTIEEAVELLRHSVLHLDNESGLVHIAASIGTKSCVVFGPTSADYYSYDTNINIRPKVCGGCWWVTEDWMVNCPKGYEDATCMFETPPEMVWRAIKDYLSEVIVNATNKPTKIGSGTEFGAQRPNGAPARRKGSQPAARHTIADLESAPDAPNPQNLLPNRARWGADVNGATEITPKKTMTDDLNCVRWTSPAEKLRGIAHDVISHFCSQNN